MVNIVTDTLSCISSNIAQTYHIPVIPQIIVFGDETYREGIDMDQHTFIERLKTSRHLPKTAAPPPEMFKQEFEKMLPNGKPILCIHPSAEMSGTVRSATVAAQDFPDADIRIIDTRVIGYPLGVMVMLAAKWAAADVSADEIITRLKGLTSHCRLYFLVDTLDFLARGGRIGNAAALIGAILQIKPILMLNNGKVDLYKKERTYKRAWAHINDRIVEEFPGQGEDYGFLNVMHAGVPEEAEKAATELKKQFGLDEVPVINLPPAIITHSGPGTIAFDFFMR